MVSHGAGGSANVYPTPPLVGATMAGFWERVETSILRLQKDPERSARYLLIAYWVSIVVVMLGALLIFLSLAGRWRG